MTRLDVLDQFKSLQDAIYDGLCASDPLMVWQEDQGDRPGGGGEGLERECQDPSGKREG